MPITVNCSNCGVRLTLGDDRAATELACPRCQHTFLVPATQQNALSLCDAAEGEISPTPRIEPEISSTSSRKPLWIGVGLGLLSVALLGGAGLALRSRADRTDDRADKTSVQAAPRSSERVLSATEEKIVGTWFESVIAEKFTRTEGTISYERDGTFSSELKITSQKDGTVRVALSGVWRVQDGLLLITFEKEKWEQVELPELRYEKLSPDGKLLVGQTHSAKIISISDTHFVTQDIDTGVHSTGKRVK